VKRGPNSVERSAPAKNEKLLLVLRPHWLDMFMARPGKWVLAIAVGTGVWFLPDSLGILNGNARLLAAFAPALLLGFYGLLDVTSRVYVVSDRRVHARGGVLTRFTVDAPLRSVTHSAMPQTLAQRALGLGTIGFATAGTDGYEVVWRCVVRPEQVLEQARKILGENS